MSNHEHGGEPDELLPNYQTDNDPDYEDVEVDEDGDEDDENSEDQEEEDDDGGDMILEMETGGGEEETRTHRLTARQLLALLRVVGDDVEVDDDGNWVTRHTPSRTQPDPNRFPKIPSEKGTELMYSGLFGSTCLRTPLTRKLPLRLLHRELALGNHATRKANKKSMAQGLIPTTNPEMIINYDEPTYSGQFSDDGNFFYAVVKDFKVRMYDTSKPYNWKHYKTVDYYPGNGQWTLSDASLSPDNMWLAYTSLCPEVALAPTDPEDTGDPYFLHLGTSPGRRTRHFRIYSIRFSGDGRELVAGASGGGLCVYDIETRRVLHHVTAHDDDVNAVCFADKLSPHILYSGSDDSSIKVWDRRSMSEGRPAGAFVGHIEGLTYLDSKGDGRYILSNGKDQSMKLWDLRMAMSSEQFAEKRPTRYSNAGSYDYRWGRYDDNEWFPHPDDNSIVTFRGHQVLQTLIRCHFSPPDSTDSRYVYSGSHDGKVWIWNMDATVAGVIDVHEATFNTRPRFNGSVVPPQRRDWQTCVRDASWHPHAPMIAASSLNGWSQDHGTCTVHSFNEAPDDEAEPKMGIRVDDKLTPRPYYHLDRDPGYRTRRWH